MEFLYSDIIKLNMGSKITQELKKNNIKTIYELCHYSRMELASLEISNNDIKQIMIALQLIGLNLKPNHAKKNNLIDK